MSKFDTSATTGTQKWKIKLSINPIINSAVIYSPPVIAFDHSRDLLVVVDNNGNVYSVDPTTGAFALIYQINAVISGSPAVDSNTTIYVGDDANNLYAISPRGNHQAKLKWTYHPPSTNYGKGIYSSPLVENTFTYGPLIYFASEDNNVYALDLNGKLKWNFPSGATIDTSPSSYRIDQVGGATSIWVASADLFLYGLDATHGSTNSELPFNCPSGNPVSSVVTHQFTGHNGNPVDIVFACGSNLYGAKFPSADAPLAFKWTAKIGVVGHSVPAYDVSRQAIYVVSGDGNVYAVSDKDGSLLWQNPFKINGFGTSSPAVGSDGTIYIGSSSGDSHVYAIKPDGTAKWSTPFPTDRPVEGSPVIGSDGTIYVGDNAGNFYAIQ